MHTSKTAQKESNGQGALDAFAGLALEPHQSGTVLQATSQTAYYLLETLRQ